MVVLDDEKWRGRVGEPKIVVVDYHKGNLSSVVRGLARAGAAACTSDDPEQIRNADGLVIPGVGAFYDAIAFMRQSGEEAAVLDAVAAGTPLLGICLGLQLFFERGNEGGIIRMVRRSGMASMLMASAKATSHSSSVKAV